MVLKSQLFVFTQNKLKGHILILTAGWGAFSRWTCLLLLSCLRVGCFVFLWRDCVWASHRLPVGEGWRASDCVWHILTSSPSPFHLSAFLLQKIHPHRLHVVFFSMVDFGGRVDFILSSCYWRSEWKTFSLFYITLKWISLGFGLPNKDN